MFTIRMLTILLSLISLVAGVAYERIDGTSLELGNHAMEVNLNNVILPKAPLITEGAR